MINSFSQKFLCKKTLFVVLLLFFGNFILLSVIPPLKSPDEHDHIERAYLLGKGVFLLDGINERNSGGFVDGGLLKYLESYPSTQKTLSLEDISTAGGVKWSGQRIYDPSPGTGYYFPVIYLPQTLGLLVGESLDLTVDHSYRLARAFALAAVAFFIYCSLRIYPTNPLVLAFLAIPMTLFQMSSASLDGISTALAIFAISAFLRITSDKDKAATWLQYAFALVIAVLASSVVSQK